MNVNAALAVAIGAAVGGVLRYAVGVAFLQRAGPGFPWGTLFVNVSGSFLVGMVAEAALSRAFGSAPLLRVFLVTGVLGGYTTFSTFTLDSLMLGTEGAAALAIAYAAGSVVLGVLAVFAGMALVRFAVR